MKSHGIKLIAGLAAFLLALCLAGGAGAAEWRTMFFTGQPEAKFQLYGHSFVVGQFDGKPIIVYATKFPEMDDLAKDAAFLGYSYGDIKAKDSKIYDAIMLVQYPKYDEGLKQDVPVSITKEKYDAILTTKSPITKADIPPALIGGYEVKMVAPTKIEEVTK